MNEKVSIAIAINGLYVGGAEKFCVTLANRFVADGYSTTMFVFKKIDSPLLNLVDKRVELVYIQRSSKFDFILHRRFNTELEKRNISKVIFIGLFPLFLTRVLSFSRKLGIAHFISLHSTIPASFKIYLQNLFYLTFARKKDKVLFICNNQRFFYNSKYFFKPAKFDVIYNGVDTEYYKPGVAPAGINQRKAMQIASSDKIILLAATLRLEKGHRYAIESLKKLHTQYPGKLNTHLVFVGGGDERYISSLKKLTTDYSLESFVHFEGNQRDVRKYYEIADIFTLTSFSVETFSLAALEAMCYGLPLSLTNIGGASEMIVEGKNGLLSNARDTDSIASSWANLLDVDFDAKVIREIAVNNFSLDKMFTKYREAVRL